MIGQNIVPASNCDFLCRLQRQEGGRSLGGRFMQVLTKIEIIKITNRFIKNMIKE